jgi:hypothetical protein
LLLGLFWTETLTAQIKQRMADLETTTPLLVDACFFHLLLSTTGVGLRLGKESSVF